MINRVHRPPILRLITSEPAATKNDPGSSQGGGNFYERPPESETPAESKATADQAENLPAPTESPSTSSHQNVKSLNSVFEELFTKRTAKPSSPGLASQYSNIGPTAKGVLLNKKIE